MTDPRPDAVAAALHEVVGLYVRRLRQLPVRADLTSPEKTALSRLDRLGPTTSAELARWEEISPQSMGATLAGLQNRGLIERRPDPKDGRRVVLSLTAAGAATLAGHRDARTDMVAQALAAGFSAAELDRLLAAVPLLERLAQAI